jgi:hypothetical protein
METVYSDEVEMFMVQKDEASGSMFLRVVVGGMAMYEVEKKMTSEMIDSFNRSPKEIIGFVKEIRLAS